jgi:GT2 family glycosyltransferase
MSEDIGVLMPRIIDEGGSLQYARRLLPRPIDILIKRFLPTMSKFLKYELPGLEVKDAINMPGLCGCFLFFNTKVLKITGLFDERFFMYYEDIDICRRIYALSKSIYFPLVSVKHHSNNEHRRNLRVFYYALVASLLYFNKWGFFDKKAKLLNNKIYKQFTDLEKKGD